MTVLVLEENQILETDRIISDLPLFLEKLSPETTLTLLIKTHEVVYHVCPVRKAIPYLKSGEYSTDHWVGHRHLANGHSLVSGVLPSPFMNTVVQIISKYALAVKNVFLWTDLIVQAYGPLETGWTFIWHNYHFLVCKDGVLQMSRLCHLPFHQEIPIILRYIRCFGYEEGTPIVLLKSSLLTETLPPFIQIEIRIPKELLLNGLKLKISTLITNQRLHILRKKLHWVACIIGCTSIIGSAYFGWQIKHSLDLRHNLNHQLEQLSPLLPVDSTKVSAFKIYQQLIIDYPSPLPIFRQLKSLLKEQAVVTYLHWTATPLTLTLHIEILPSIEIESFIASLRSHFSDYTLKWEPLQDTPLKGTLTLEKHTLNKYENS